MKQKIKKVSVVIAVFIFCVVYGIMFYLLGRSPDNAIFGILGLANLWMALEGIQCLIWSKDDEN